MRSLLGLFGSTLRENRPVGHVRLARIAGGVRIGVAFLCDQQGRVGWGDARAHPAETPK